MFVLSWSFKRKIIFFTFLHYINLPSVYLDLKLSLLHDDLIYIYL